MVGGWESNEKRHVMLLTQYLKLVLRVHQMLTIVLFSALKKGRSVEFFTLFFWVSLSRTNQIVGGKKLSLGRLHLTLLLLWERKNGELVLAYGRCLRGLPCTVDASLLKAAFLEGWCHCITTQDGYHPLWGQRGPWEVGEASGCIWYHVKDPWHFMSVILDLLGGVSISE